MADKQMEPQEIEASIYDEIMDAVRWCDGAATVGYMAIGSETIAVRREWMDRWHYAKAMLADLDVVDIGTRAESAHSGRINEAFVARILENDNED